MDMSDNSSTWFTPLFCCVCVCVILVIRSTRNNCFYFDINLNSLHPPSLLSAQRRRRKSTVAASHVDTLLINNLFTPVAKKKKKKRRRRRRKTISNSLDSIVVCVKMSDRLVITSTSHFGPWLVFSWPYFFTKETTLTNGYKEGGRAMAHHLLFRLHLNPLLRDLFGSLLISFGAFISPLLSINSQSSVSTVQCHHTA